MAAGAILLSSSTSVFAYEYNAENADKLKKQIESSYTWKTLKVNEESGILGLDGEITVTPMDKYFSVAYPNIKIKMGEQNLDMGIPKLNMIPVDDNAESGNWKFTAKIPSPMKIFDAQAKQVGSITIGKQVSQGIWNVSSGITPLMNTVYSDIKLQYNGLDLLGKPSSINMSVKDFAFKTKLEQDADKTWSGPSMFRMNDFSVNIADEYVLSIDNVSTDNKYTGLDISKQVVMLDSIGGLSGKGDNLKPEDMLGFSSSFFDMLDSLFKDSETNFKMSGLKFKSTKDIGNVAKTDKPFSLEIASLDATYNVYDFNSDNTKIIIKDTIKGIKVDGVAEVYKSMIPSEINFDSEVNKLPMQKIMTLVKGGFDSLVEKPEDTAELAAVSAKLPSLLSDHGTSIVIKDSFINSKNLKVKMEGDAVADKTATKMAIAKMLFKFSGITAALAELSQNPSDDPSIMMVSQQAQMGLGMLQAMGKTEANGDVTYKVELTKDGQMLMNGNSFGGMMGGGMGAPMPMEGPK